MDNNQSDSQISDSVKKMAVNKAADVAMSSGNPYAMAAGGVVKVADKLTGGKSSEALGNVLENAKGKNKSLPGINHSNQNPDDENDDNNKSLPNNNDLKSEGLPVEDKSLENQSINSNNNSNVNTGKTESDLEKNSNNSFITGKGNKFGLENLLKNKVKTYILSGVLSFMFFLIIVVCIVALIYYPLNSAKEFFSNLWDNATNFFSNLFNESDAKLEEEYYQELKDTQISIKEKYQQCIDINLITATLTVNRSFDDFLIDGKEEIENIDADSTNDESNEGSMYKKMKKEVRLLANMQLTRKKYSLDKVLRDNTGNYCSTTSEMEPVDDSNSSSFIIDGFEWLTGDIPLDSSSYEKIARNDEESIFSFFEKKVDKEKNYAYYIYRPTFDADGNCSDDYAKSMLPEDEISLSIGNYETREDSVYYWNLVNSFIGDYYKEYLPSTTDPTYRDEVIKIADDIYLLYDQIGPSQTCSTDVAYTGPSALCPNGITIENVGTLDFEEYVAGVVSREAYTSEGEEALKAQAVAARTYALNKTNYCQKTIANSTNAQTFTRDINDNARKAVAATSGQILTYNGQVFSSMYDSFCYDDKDCPDSKKNSNGTYTVTYTKEPLGEKHVITLSDSSQYKRLTHGQGHAHGMSQLLSYQMAKEGKTYDQILKYFYSEGVVIEKTTSALPTDGSTIISQSIAQILQAKNSSVENFNQYIKTQVKSAGVGTRNGVVAAAVSLTSGLYSQTSYILPYELHPSGKYKGYGIDPNWGTNTGNSDYPSNGLDCSGFISWAIHNAGYKYESLSARGWGNVSTSRAWNTGTDDRNALPGDLIFNKPKSDNGTTGHIKMIVGVTDKGYIVAEAANRKAGVRVKEIPFISTGNFYIVDMTNYYNNPENIDSSYPQ